MQEEMSGNGGRVRTMALVFGYEHQEETGRIMSALDTIRAKAADLNKRLDVLEYRGRRSGQTGTPEFTAEWNRSTGKISGEYNPPASHQPEQVAVWDRGTGKIRRT
jgi:hypothetical protein